MCLRICVHLLKTASADEKVILEKNQEKPNAGLGMVPPPPILCVQVLMAPAKHVRLTSSRLGHNFSISATLT